MSGIERGSNSERKKLYVGCALSLAPEPFKNEVEQLKERLRKDWDVMEFLGLVDGTEVDVYETDIILNVGNCDAFIGICDEPSLGLGWEMSRATVLEKPTLAVAHVGSRVTRLVLGAPAFNPTMTFRQYEDMVADVPPMALEAFAHIL